MNIVNSWRHPSSSACDALATSLTDSLYRQDTVPLFTNIMCINIIANEVARYWLKCVRPLHATIAALPTLSLLRGWVQTCCYIAPQESSDALWKTSCHKWLSYNLLCCAPVPSHSVHLVDTTYTTDEQLELINKCWIPWRHLLICSMITV